ncbi:hypothetical protein GCM10010358_50910 [Streptomyces minutiscleroticus]|uniref:Uncharacterized protein n=1 Tax=Streptomyces minutiscleroticus TaxID=68238 RepID=A0A918NRT0_9ACTN|nr:hypothetical protein GCM10010358_50910 [Streptomyces minutiscleroticus]
MRYEIRIEGHMSRMLTEAFPELDHVVMSHQTVLFGPVVDEAHLYGLLARCQSLGLHVVEMRRMPERGDETHETGTHETRGRGDAAGS